MYALAHVPEKTVFPFVFDVLQFVTVTVHTAGAVVLVVAGALLVPVVLVVAAGELVARATGGAGSAGSATGAGAVAGSGGVVASTVAAVEPGTIGAPV